jgi:transposase
MEACGSAHYWAHQFSALGHTVKLMAPQFVKPYVKTNKHDAADAEGNCEAVSRPSMRFVPVKNPTQLALLGLHRARQKFVAEGKGKANEPETLVTVQLLCSFERCTPVWPTFNKIFARRRIRLTRSPLLF